MQTNKKNLQRQQQQQRNSNINSNNAKKLNLKLTVIIIKDIPVPNTQFNNGGLPFEPQSGLLLLLLSSTPSLLLVLVLLVLLIICNIDITRHDIPVANNINDVDIPQIAKLPNVKCSERLVLLLVALFGIIIIIIRLD
jgi:hypothetical protein